MHCTPSRFRMVGLVVKPAHRAGGINRAADDRCWRRARRHAVPGRALGCAVRLQCVCRVGILHKPPPLAAPTEEHPRRAPLLPLCHRRAVQEEAHMRVGHVLLLVVREHLKHLLRSPAAEGPPPRDCGSHCMMRSWAQRPLGRGVPQGCCQHCRCADRSNQGGGEGLQREVGRRHAVRALAPAKAVSLDLRGPGPPAAYPTRSPTPALLCQVERGSQWRAPTTSRSSRPASGARRWARQATRPSCGSTCRWGGLRRAGPPRPHRNHPDSWACRLPQGAARGPAPPLPDPPRLGQAFLERSCKLRAGRRPQHRDFHGVRLR